MNLDKFNLGQCNNKEILVETKKEYTYQLISNLSEHIYDGLKSIYDSSIFESQKKKTDNNFILFQKYLENIPKWNQEIIEGEYKRIVTKSGCDYLQDLISAVFISFAKVLTYGSKTENSIKLEIPKVHHFIHKCYIETAREIWKNPWLFSEVCDAVKRQKNLHEIFTLINESIIKTVRKMIPINHILQNFIGSQKIINTQDNIDIYSEKNNLNEYDLYDETSKKDEVDINENNRYEEDNRDDEYKINDEDNRDDEYKINDEDNRKDENKRDDKINEEDNRDDEYIRDNENKRDVDDKINEEDKRDDEDIKDNEYIRDDEDKRDDEDIKDNEDKMNNIKEGGNIKLDIEEDGNIKLDIEEDGNIKLDIEEEKENNDLKEINNTDDELNLDDYEQISLDIEKELSNNIVDLYKDINLDNSVVEKEYEKNTLDTMFSKNDKDYNKINDDVNLHINNEIKKIPIKNNENDNKYQYYKDIIEKSNISSDSDIEDNNTTILNTDDELVGMFETDIDENNANENNANENNANENNADENNSNENNANENNANEKKSNELEDKIKKLLETIEQKDKKILDLKNKKIKKKIKTKRKKRKNIKSIKIPSKCLFISDSE